MHLSNRKPVTALAGGLLLLAGGNSHAISFDLGGLGVSLQNSITAGVAVRGENADDELIGKANLADQIDVDASFPGAFSTNGDDGNLNYQDSGDLFFAQIKLSSDLTIEYGDYGLFARGNYRWDPNALSNDFFDPFDYGPNRSLSEDVRQRRENNAEEAIGNDAELFDLYLFGNTRLFDRNLSVRVGRQVLNWGESTFIQNGINSIIPIDARQARGPGAEVKEIFRPFGMVWASIDLVQNFSIEGFYQFEWEETLPDPSGTFFSTSDFLGAGSAPVQIGFGRCNENITPIPALGGGDPSCDDAVGGTNVVELEENDAENGGQYGFRLAYFAEWLNATEISLYAVNYHSRLPLLSGRNVNTPGVASSGGAFFREYPEDIKLYGISFNGFSEILGSAVQGEYSFHQDQPLQLDDVDVLLYALGVEQAVAAQTGGQAVNATSVDEVRGEFVPGATFDGFERFDYHQWNLSLTKFLGPNFTGANQTIILLEGAAQYVADLPDPADLPFEAGGTFVPNQAEGAAALGLPSQDRDGYADDFSWGYRLAVAFRYQNVFNRFNLTPSIRFFHDVGGNSPVPISTFLEDRKQFSLALAGSYLDAWEAGLSYTFFFDSADTAASPIDPATEAGQRTSGFTNNVVEDRDFANLFVRYTF